MNSNGGNLEFLDLLNIASFCIGLMNLNSNLTQNDKQDLEEQLNRSVQKLLQEIHTHLEQQDKKIDSILKKLGVNNDDS